MKIYGGDMTDQMPIGEIYGSEITVTNAHRWKIYGGESEMSIDAQSIVVR